MKKIIAVIISMALLAGMLSACGGQSAPATTQPAETKATDTKAPETAAPTEAPAQESATDYYQGEAQTEESLEGVLVGVTIVTLGNSEIKGKAEKMKELLEAQGAEVNLMSAENDSNTQLQQVEQFIAMGCDAIGIHAVNTDTLEAITKEALDAGITVSFFGAKPNFPFTSYSGTDNSRSGKICADMALEFVSERYPDASAENPIEIIMMSNYKTGNHAAFSKAAIPRLEEDPRVKIVYDDPDLPDEVMQSQNRIEELFGSYPNAKIFLCPSETGAIGASNAIMAMFGDADGYACFASTCDPLGIEMVEKSATNESAVRGLLNFPQSAVAWYNATYGAITGEYTDSYEDWLEVDPVTTIDFTYDPANYVE